MSGNLALRVGHVRADVGKVFEEPETAKGESGGFPHPEKIKGAEERNEQFSERSAEDHDGVAEPTEEEMAAFVDDQIDVVENEKAGTISERVKKEESVEAEPGDTGAARDRFPFAELVFEEGHLVKRNKRGSGGKVFVRICCQGFGNRLLGAQ
jgi:hypothetical protein